MTLDLPPGAARPIVMLDSVTASITGGAASGIYRVLFGTSVSAITLLAARFNAVTSSSSILHLTWPEGRGPVLQADVEGQADTVTVICNKISGTDSASTDLTATYHIEGQ